MAQTIKEAISGLTGIVIREGDRFKLGEKVKGIPLLHPRFCDYINSRYACLPEDARNHLISILTDLGIVAKALVKDVDSDHIGVRYHDADEDVGLLCEDSNDYAGYRLVLWRDLDAVYSNPPTTGCNYQKLRTEGIRPPVIRYLKQKN